MGIWLRAQRSFLPPLRWWRLRCGLCGLCGWGRVGFFAKRRALCVVQVRRARAAAGVGEVAVRGDFCVERYNRGRER